MIEANQNKMLPPLPPTLKKKSQYSAVQQSEPKSKSQNKDKKRQDQKHVQGSRFEMYIMKHLHSIFQQKNIDSQFFSFFTSQKAIKEYVEDIKDALDSNQILNNQDKSLAKKTIIQMLYQNFKIFDGNFLQAQIDIRPNLLVQKSREHIRTKINQLDDFILIEDMFQSNVMRKKCSKKEEVNKSLEQAKGETAASEGLSKEIQFICAGQIKRNFFNANEIIKLRFTDYFKDKKFEPKQKVGLKRTLEFIKKIAAIRRWEIQEIKEKVVFQSVRQKFRNSLSLKTLNEQIHIGNISKLYPEKPIIFFICLKHSGPMTKQLFKDMLGPINAKFWEFFCQKERIQLNILCFQRKDQIDELKEQIKNMDEKMSQQIKNMDEKMNQQIKNMDEKMNQQMKSINDILAILQTLVPKTEEK